LLLLPLSVSLIYAYQPDEIPQEEVSYTFKPYGVQETAAKKESRLNVDALLALFTEDEEEAVTPTLPEVVAEVETKILASRPVPNLEMPMFSGEPKEFIEFMAPYAQELWDRYKILPSLTLAQSIIESGFGRSTIGWNVSGTKACCQSAGIHDVFVYYMGTSMEVAGTCDQHTNRKKTKLWTTEGADASVRTEKWFAYYNTADEFMEARYRVLKNENAYPDLLGETDYMAATEKVRKYATNKDYVDLLRTLIRDYALTAYDPSESP
jgi:flagellum-specific peptidoglycan hydrolase FlgJ